MKSQSTPVWRTLLEDVTQPRSLVTQNETGSRVHRIPITEATYSTTERQGPGRAYWFEKADDARAFAVEKAKLGHKVIYDSYSPDYVWVSYSKKFTSEKVKQVLAGIDPIAVAEIGEAVDSRGVAPEDKPGPVKLSDLVAYHARSWGGAMNLHHRLIPDLKRQGRLVKDVEDYPAPTAVDAQGRNALPANIRPVREGDNDWPSWVPGEPNPPAGKGRNPNMDSYIAQQSKMVGTPKSQRLAAVDDKAFVQRVHQKLKAMGLPAFLDDGYHGTTIYFDGDGWGGSIGTLDSPTWTGAIHVGTMGEPIRGKKLIKIETNLDQYDKDVNKVGNGLYKTIKDALSKLGLREDAFSAGSGQDAATAAVAFNGAANMKKLSTKAQQFRPGASGAAQDMKRTIDTMTPNQAKAAMAIAATPKNTPGSQGAPAPRPIPMMNSLDLLQSLKLRMVEAAKPELAPQTAKGKAPTGKSDPLVSKGSGKKEPAPVTAAVTPLRYQAATVIAKTLGGARISGPMTDFKLAGGTPEQLINIALRAYLRVAHTVESWHTTGRMLELARSMNIKWDPTILSPSHRKIMDLA